MSKTVRLNCFDPWCAERPHYPQQQFLSLPVSSDKIARVHFVSGRGGGKTLAAVLHTYKTMRENPGIRGVMFSPTFQKLRDIFLNTWLDTIPPELYELRRTEMVIDFYNGSQLMMRSRHVDNPSRGRDVARGLDVNFVGDDEAAEGFDLETYTNISACIRRAGSVRYHACYTTPRLNDYYALATRPDHVVVYSSSRDNPHLPAGWVDELASQMSDAQAARELEGRWVALEGLVWGVWSDEDWPTGNIHSHTFDPSLPWYLFLDLGVGNGAYVVAQQLPAKKSGIQLFDGSVWVAVGQVTPTSDGSAARCFQLLKQHYGTPSAVIAGADIHTRASTDGYTSAYFVEQSFGSIPIIPVKGWIADKQIQVDRLSYLIKSATGERRFCASKHIETLDADNRKKRGILELMKQDTWPDNAGKTRGVFLRKEGVLEHMRDALLYGAVGIMTPPNLGMTSRLVSRH